MALTTNATTKVTQLYVAMFGRAPDFEGLNFWGGALDAGQSVAKIAQDMFATTPARAYFPAGSTSQEVIQAFYVNVLGRQPDAEGLEFWVARLDALKGTGNANAEGQVVSEIINIVANYQGNTPEGAQSAQLFANKMEVAKFWTAENGGIENSAKPIALVNATEGSVNQVKAQILNGFGELVADHVFTLKQAEIKAADIVTSVAPVVKNVTYVGLSVNGSGEAGVPLYDLDQYGNPVSYIYEYASTGEVIDIEPQFTGNGSVVVQKGLFSYLKDVTGLDFVQLGLINIANGSDNGLDNGMDGTSGSSGQQAYPDLSSFTITANNTDGSTGTVNATISFAYGDGHIHQAEVDISEKYFKLLTNLVFDADNNLRLYEKQVTIYPKVALKDASGAPVYDVYGNPIMVDLTRVVTEGDTVKLPIVLTTSVNNGGTEEKGYTANGVSDTIKVGRLDLLHGAYIDGGTGPDNTLEIFAKGYFAQPKELLNIQHISIENLPNIYTSANGTNGYPDLNAGSGSGDYTASIIDLSAAGQIETLTVTEGDFTGAAGGATSVPGVLTVTGIRNGAEVTLDGAFSKDVKLNFSDLQGAGVDLVLHNVNFGVQGQTANGAQLVVAHNSNTLNIESTGGGNFIANADLVDGNAGGLTTLNISGTASLFIEGDLNPSFHNATPVTINASANTGGVNLTLSASQNVTFVGSQGNDRFSVQTAEYEGQPVNDETVTIQGGVGNNYYEVIGADKVSITNADGNNNYEIVRDGGTSTDLVTITAGNGANHFEIDRASTAVLTVGNGNNKFDVVSVNSYDYLVGSSVGYKSNVTIVAGNGANDMDISADANIGTVKVTAGNGGNAINISAATINVTAGSGADDIRVEGRDITVDAGGSGNTITVVGTDGDYADNSALIKINAGTNSVVNLGSGNDPQSAANDDFPGTGDITAKVGSSITGTNITLVVDTVADLRAATLSGITKIVLDDDNVSYTNSNPANTDVDKALLTLTDKQVAALVAAGTTIEVDGGIFNTSAHIKVIVTANLDVTTGAWATWLSSLPASVDLKFEINDGATLKLTAQQLHTKVASGGISIADDGNTDQVSGKVYITGAGLDFDPFNSNDQVRTTIDSRQYVGGSLSADFVRDLNNNGTADEIANGVQRNEWGYNVLIDRVTYGYNRPADAPSYSRLTIDTDVQGSTIGPFSTIETFLRIVGEADMTFTPMKGGIDEWGAPIKGGTSIELGMDKGVPTNKFMVDFSEAGGAVTDLALGHFQMAQAIYGNGTANAPARINVEIDDNLAPGDGDGPQDSVASSTSGLVSRGVQTYVVTKIDDSNAGGDSTVEFWTSRVTEDLKTLGLRGNFGDTIIFGNTERGVDFLLEVAYDKFDGYAVGNLHADFARPDGATAVVNVVGLAALPANEVQKVASVVTNGTGLTINVAGGNTVIGAIGGENLDDVALNTANNLTITTAVDLEGGLETFDASGVVGNLTMTLTGDATGAGFAFTAADGTTTLTLNDVTAGTHSSFSADAAANFNLVVIGEDESASDLSKATLTNVDTLTLGKVAVNAQNQTVYTDGAVTLSAAQALDIGLADIKLAHPVNVDGTLNIVNLGSQAFSAADLGAGVELGTVTIAAGNVTLNAATVLTGAAVTVAAGSTLTLTADQFMALADLDGVLTTGVANAVINITGLTQAHIDAGFTLENLEHATGTITLAENVNLADDTDLNDFAVTLADGQTLGVATYAQANGLDVTGGVGSTIKLLFGGLTDDQTIDASGYNVDDLRFLDSLVSGHNVDAIFTGLLARVEKIVYNNYVSVIDQTVTISAGAVVNGNLFFDRTEANLELQNFVLNLEGGTRIANVDLGAAAGPAGTLQTYLKTVTINSTGTMANPVSGATGNIMGTLTGGTGDTENDLLNVTINASQALQMTGVTFTNVGSTNGVATLTVTGTSNVNVGALNTQDDDVDGLNVVNNGTGTVTVGINAANIDQDAGNTDALSFTGTGAIVLNVTGSVDLSDDTLTAVSKLVLTQGANVTLTMAQADAIGASDIVVAAAGNTATLNLEGLAEEPFAVANFGTGVTVSLMTLAAQPVITLNAATNLTGINGLVVPEGTVLNLTAAQFQQLGNGAGVSGTITGVKADGTPSTNITVNITGLTQADVAHGFDLSGVAAANLTVTLAQDVSLSTPSPVPANWDGIDLGTADINIGGFKFTLESVALANGLNITGTAGSVLKFTDTVANPADQIDASGFDVSELHMTAQLIGGQNVDLLFEGLAASVTKVVTDDYGYVTGTTQTVVIQGGSTITNDVAFIKQEGNVEILDFTMSLQGGVYFDGDVNLSKDGNTTAIPKHLQTVTINSTGTTANVLNGGTANIITGALTSLSFGPGTEENNLLNVTINASQALVVRGGVVFNSVTGDDLVTANDNSSAVANLTVGGSANVTIGSITAASGGGAIVNGVNTTDDDVDALNVVNNGTGTLNLVLSASNFDATDALSFTGSGAIALQVVGTNFDLSDADLSAVTTITVGNKSSVTNGDLDLNGLITLSQAQLSDVTLVDGTDADATATVNVVDFVGSVPFVSTGLGVAVGTITMAPGPQTLASGTVLTGVTQIIVPEGGTLSLTAAQFQQLQGSGSIVGFDTDGVGGITPINVVITDLKQSDLWVDADGDGQFDAGEGFNLGGVNTSGGTITISLGEPSVDLGTFNTSGALVANSAAVLNGAQFVLGAGQTLGLVNLDQANGLDVTGGANSTLVYKFSSFNTPNPNSINQIDASGYNVTTLKALAASFVVAGASSNVEYKIDDLPSSVTLRLYADPADLGYLDPTFRVVVIEAGITTPAGLIFNDWDTDDEVRTLSLTLEGNATLSGDLSLPTRTGKDVDLTQRYFDTLTIHSEGAAGNTINGSINTVAVGPNPNTSENSLLKVNIVAAQNLVINGDIAFNAVGAETNPDATATLTLTGTANVTINHLDITNTDENDIGTLAIANNLTSTGTLTVLGGTPAIKGSPAFVKLTITGTGNTVLGVDPAQNDEDGIDSATLSVIDASGSSGALTIGAMVNIDSGSFTFTSGTGVTSLTLSDAVFSGYGADNAVGGTGPNADGSGWNFDFSNAAAGSVFHLNAPYSSADVGVLTINLGSNTTLYIDQSMDLTGMDLTILQTQKIVLADGAILTLTADQANGLEIIAGPDTSPAGITAKVNIVGLTNDTDPDNPVDAIDLSGIAQNIAGTIKFKAGVNDVTLDKATNLGFFAVELIALQDDGTADLSGQTIRFQNVAQAGRTVLVTDASGVTGAGNAALDADFNSTNVVWLFDSVTAPVNTNGYFKLGAGGYSVGRLWLNETLSNGANVENLFTSLPNAIIRVDFASLADLEELLTSQPVNRVVELASFTNLPAGLIFNDQDVLEHVKTLTIKMGGQVAVGNLVIDNIIDNSKTYTTPVTFDSLTIESWLADDTGDLLAREGFDESVNVKPVSGNTVGNISVGTDNNIDLLSVTIDTKTAEATNNLTVLEGAPNDVLTGTAITIGTITFDASVAGSDALLNVKGANNITIASVVATDPDFDLVTVDATGFTGTLSAPGTSPAIQLGAGVERLVIKGGAAGVTPSVINLGSDAIANPNAGVTGAGLSVIDASTYLGTLNLGILALVDGTNDDLDTSTPVNDGLVPAFRLTSGSGITTATLGKDPDSANVPTLAAGSEWIFDYDNAAVGSRLTITSDVVFGTPVAPATALPKLTLIDVELYIQGDVDLSGVDISLGGWSDIHVPLGQSLTLTYDQAINLGHGGVEVTGDGTVHIVGEVNTDAPVSLDLSTHIHTVGVDLSGLTNAGLVVPQTNPVEVLLNNGGAEDDLGNPVGFHVTGSAFNDAITGSTYNDVFDGGAGNDSLTGNGGSDTFLVTAGTDTILDLAGNGAAAGGDDDVLVVSAGATALATNITQFIATADTVNNGTATLSTGTGFLIIGPHTIDVSAAGGANGFNLVGSGDVLFGNDVLIGSDQADVIVGGGNNQTAGVFDTLTGNGGADIFRFTTTTSVPQTLTVQTVADGAPNAVGVDWERVVVDPTVGAAAGTITIPYSVNGAAIPASLTVTLIGGETETDIATAISNAFIAAGFNTSVSGAAVEVRGANGNSLQLGLYDEGTTGATGLTGNSVANADVAQVTRVELSHDAAIVAGETYALSLTLIGTATAIQLSYTAKAGDGYVQVTKGLADAINALGGGALAASYDNVLGDWVQINDVVANNGGFTLVSSATGGFAGSSASDTNADDWNSSDVITDFAPGDKVDFQGGVAPTALNYADAGQVADYATALSNANAALNGTIRYYLTSVLDIDAGTAGNQTTGVLFFDADGDSVADGAVRLTGVTSANFDHTDITASPVPVV